MPKLRESEDDLFALVGAASEFFKIPDEFVEKDFWVTELLRSVATPIDDAILIFKGGTSLSKAFGLIDRFSEDVDILVSLDPELGKGAVHKILKMVCTRAGEDIGIPSERQMTLNSETGIHRSVQYLYPSRFPSRTLKQGVLLELGRRGAETPRERRSIRSMIGRYVAETGSASEDEFDEFRPFEIDVLAPERTLVEKLSLLHRLGVEDGERATNYGRHLYDVYRLLTNESILRRLREDPSAVETLADETLRQSSQWGFPAEPRPRDGFSNSPIFDAEGPSARSLRQGLELAAPLIYGDVPTFEQCLEAVRSAAELL